MHVHPHVIAGTIAWPRVAVRARLRFSFVLCALIVCTVTSAFAEQPESARHGQRGKQGTNIRIKIRSIEGMFLVYDAPVPPGGQRGFMAYWNDFETRQLLVYGRTLSGPRDVGHALVNLGDDMGVDVMSFAEADERLGNGVDLALDELPDENVWMPATSETLFLVAGLELPEGQVAEVNDPPLSDQCDPPPLPVAVRGGGRGRSGQRRSKGVLVPTSPAIPRPDLSPSDLFARTMSVANCGTSVSPNNPVPTEPPCICCPLGVVATSGTIPCCEGSPCDDLNACTDSETCVLSSTQCTSSGGVVSDYDDLCCGAQIECDDGDLCTQDSCDRSSGCRFEQRCTTPPNDTCCAGNGACCATACDACVSYGNLNGGVIDVTPIPACVGDTLRFEARDVVDTGATKKLDCVPGVQIPPALITYTWTIVPPPQLTPTSGAGPVATIVASVPGNYACTFGASAIRECEPPSIDVGPVTASTSGIAISARVIDQDDPTNSAWKSVGAGDPVYGGSENSTADNLTLSVAPELGAANNIAWSVTGSGSAGWALPPSGPSATIWDLGDLLAPQPGPVEFDVVITYTDGGKQCGKFASEIGVRTDDVILVGWIDPNNVPLNATGVSSGLLTLLPLGGPPVVITPPCSACEVVLALASGDTNPCNFPVTSPLNDRNREYFLHWMFKYGGNIDPALLIPGGDFRNAADTHIDETEVQNFVLQGTTLKLYNRLQVKYLADAVGFQSNPVLVQSQFAVGGTVNPFAACPLTLNPDPGQIGPNNGKLMQTAKSIWQVNEGSPDSSAVLTFNTLMGNAVPSAPLFWESIGSRIRFRYDDRTEPSISVQVYPTYEEYHNGKKVARHPQQLDPQNNFFQFPYPFGLVPCTGIPFPHQQGRCGDAVSPEDVTARVPTFLP